MYDEGSEEQSYAAPAGGFREKIAYHFEGLIPLILIIIVAALAGAWLGLWNVPYITHAGPAKLLVIGQPSQITQEALDSAKDIVTYRIRDMESLSVNPTPQLAQYDIIMLDQTNSAQGPYISRTLGEAIENFVKKGGKLIIVGNSGILRPDAPEIVGWLANLGDIAPVECVLDKHNVPTCIQPIRLRGELIKLDFDNPIMEGIERVPALPGEPPLNFTVYNVAIKGNEIAYIKDVDSTKWYPGIVERRHILGKVIYFNYDPGLTRAIFEKTLEYLH